MAWQGKRNQPNDIDAVFAAVRSYRRWCAIGAAVYGLLIIAMFWLQFT